MNELQIQRSIEFCRSNIDQALAQLEMPNGVRPMLFRSVHDHFNPRGGWGLNRLDEQIRKIELRPELWTAWYIPAVNLLGEDTIKYAISSVQKWHETMRCWRVGREANKFKNIKDRMDEVLENTKKLIGDSVYPYEKRKYDFSIIVEFGIKPNIEVLHTINNVRAQFHVTPAWRHKVGKRRAVMFKETKHRTFVFDSESFDNSEMNDRGVSCFKLHGFGLIKEIYHKAEISDLRYRYNQINKNENISYVDAYKEFKIGNLNLSRLQDGIEDILSQSYELVESYKHNRPCKYSMFYLEHETLPLSSVGHTLLHAKNLLNRRLKKATLDALI